MQTRLSESAHDFGQTLQKILSKLIDATLGQNKNPNADTYFDELVRDQALRNPGSASPFFENSRKIKKITIPY